MTYLKFLLAFSLFAQDNIKEQFPRHIQDTLTYEWYANSFNRPELRGSEDKKGEQYFEVEYFKIPLRSLSEYSLDSLNEDVKKSLIIKENGEEFLRYVVNPEDSHYHGIVSDILRSQRLDSKKYKGDLYGALTASRSMLIMDKKTKKVFSAKVSTNKTGGAWQDKGVNRNQALKAILASGHVEEINKQVKYQHMEPLLETTSFVLRRRPGFARAEQTYGMIVRELNGAADERELRILPGFAVMNDHKIMNNNTQSVAEYIAKKNGSNDPVEFWLKNYIGPQGRAVAEYAAYHGLSYESAHGQQFAIEIDKNLKPGRIVLRDFNDSFALVPFFSKRMKRNRNFLDKWLNHYKKKNLEVRFGAFKGSGAPAWMSPDDMRRAKDLFFREFEKTYSKITGIPVSVLQQLSTESNGDIKQSYRTKTYKVMGMFNRYKSPYWKSYFDITPCFQGEEMTRSGKSCKEVLSALHKKMGNDSSLCLQ